MEVEGSKAVEDMDMEDAKYKEQNGMEASSGSDDGFKKPKGTGNRKRGR